MLDKFAAVGILQVRVAKCLSLSIFLMLSKLFIGLTVKPIRTRVTYALKYLSENTLLLEQGYLDYVNRCGVNPDVKDHAGNS